MESVTHGSLDRTTRSIGLAASRLSSIPYSLMDYGFLFLGCLFVVLFVVISTTIFMNKSGVDRHSLFFVLYEDRIKRVFRKQSRDAHSTIVSGVNHILRPLPERPTVILLLVPAGTGTTALRLAETLTQIVVAVFQTAIAPETKSMTLAGGDFALPDDYWRFYESLIHIMVDFRVAIITDFQCMSAQVATVLCHLADDTYAPYPQALLLILLNISDQFSKEQLQRQAPVSIAEMFLEDLWEFSLDKDILTDLLGRITGRAVLVEEEKPLS